MQVSDDLRRALEKVKAADEAKNKALAELAVLQSGPVTIDATDPKAVSANLEGLANGTVIAERPGDRKKRGLKANEIDYRDQSKISKFLPLVANGAVVVVDADRLYEGD